MKLNHAQKVFLKFVAKTQLYITLAVLALVVFGVVFKFPWEISRVSALVLFIVNEAAAIYYMAKLNRQLAIWSSKHDHDCSQE